MKKDSKTLGTASRLAKNCAGTFQNKTENQTERR